MADIAFSLIPVVHISYLSFRLVRNLSKEGLPTSGNDIRDGTIGKRNRSNAISANKPETPCLFQPKNFIIYE